MTSKYYEHPIAEHDGWRLVQASFKAGGRPGEWWTNFKLYRPTDALPRGRSRCVFWIGWNGKRFAVGNDMTDLRECHPAVLDWAKEIIRETKQEAVRNGDL